MPPSISSPNSACARTSCTPWKSSPKGRQGLPSLPSGAPAADCLHASCWGLHLNSSTLPREHGQGTHQVCDVDETPRLGRGAVEASGRHTVAPPSPGHGARSFSASAHRLLPGSESHSHISPATWGDTACHHPRPGKSTQHPSQQWLLGAWASELPSQRAARAGPRHLGTRAPDPSQADASSPSQLPRTG